MANERTIEEKIADLTPGQKAEYEKNCRESFEDYDFLKMNGLDIVNPNPKKVREIIYQEMYEGKSVFNLLDLM